MTTGSFQTTLRDAEIRFTRRSFLKPLRLSSGSIHDITEAEATVRVVVDGREGVGRGCIYLSDLWSWPDPQRPHEQRDEALRLFCTGIASSLKRLTGDEAAHPLALGLRLHGSLCGADHDPDGPPLLARLICGSPFDAAIHDAAGRALQRSAFSLYEEPTAIPEADPWFEGGAVEAIRAAFRSPVNALDAWLIVGQDDTPDDIAPWIQQRGYRAFKLKLLGKETAADVRRTGELFRIVRKLGASSPRLAVDANCGVPNSDAVLDYLQHLAADEPEACAALEYLEQPTARDIARSPNDWRAVARLKLVILDEGLMRMEDVVLACEQGWSGIAVKTCRGHSFSLLSAACARQRGLLLAMQDLTNPGLAAIHSALCAAHLPVFNGIELNSPQYTPEANAEWLPRLAPLLEPIDGKHRLPDVAPVGLGAQL